MDEAAKGAGKIASLMDSPFQQFVDGHVTNASPSTLGAFNTDFIFAFWRHNNTR